MISRSFGDCAFFLRLRPLMKRAVFLGPLRSSSKFGITIVRMGGGRSRVVTQRLNFNENIHPTPQFYYRKAMLHHYVAKTLHETRDINVLRPTILRRLCHNHTTSDS